MARYNKFNFVMFLATSSIYSEIAFYDAYALNNVRVINFNFTTNNKELTINFSPYYPLNNPVAFKNLQTFDIDSPQVFAKDFLTQAPIVFFFLANEYNIFQAMDFFNYLRANYVDCKLVCWLANPVYYYQDVNLLFLKDSDTKEFLSTFDCVITYNQIDAIDYGMTYFEGPYSVLPFKQTKENFDIFFVGRPKDRLEKILRAYETFKAAGFICNFYINDILDPPKIKSEGLHFNHMLSYPEVVEHVIHSKAVLDIAQKGTYGLTARYLESLAYDKNFITDNPFYRQDRFFSPKLFLIDRGYDIDKRQFMNAAELSNNYRNEYSPLRLISFLESVLNS